MYTPVHLHSWKLTTFFKVAQTEYQAYRQNVSCLINETIKLNWMHPQEIKGKAHIFITI